MVALPRLKAGLLKHDLDNQVLIYDSADDRVHLLDATTARVYSLLEQDVWTYESAAAELSRRPGVAEAKGLVDLAIDELRSARLLDNPGGSIDMSRRELLRSAALTGAAALLLPAIVTLTATPGYAQGSATVGHCGACTDSSQCMNGETCQTNTGGTACGNPGAPLGAACSNNGLCCSNKCTGGVCVP
jgi:hypothetical protein